MPLADFQSLFPHLCRRLLQARRHGRVGHAYLVIGDEPAFLESFVLSWIQVCSCPQPGEDADACGACPSCRAVAEKRSPELHWVQPRSKTRQIVIEDVRRLEHEVNLKAGTGKTKVAVIAEADRMNEESQNAFLKTLEEPPQHTIVILYSTNARRLLPTIRSRCQTISLLQNRRNYDLPLELGLFRILAPLQRGAGAAEAVRATESILTLLNGIRGKATETVGPVDENRMQMLEEQDPKLRKQAEEEHALRIEAEYRRLRQLVIEALRTWFEQLVLVAADVPRNQLPHPELLDAADNDAIRETITSEDAERNLRLTRLLLTDLQGNMPEKIAVQAFCLGVCDKSA